MTHSKIYFYRLTNREREGASELEGRREEEKEKQPKSEHTIKRKRAAIICLVAFIFIFFSSNRLTEHERDKRTNENFFSHHMNVQSRGKRRNTEPIHATMIYFVIRVYL